MFTNLYRSSNYSKSIALAATLLCIQISAASAQQIAIAIMDLEGIGISTSESMTLTNRLRNELFQLGKFEVVERAMMEGILAEQDFQLTGCTSNDCLVEIGMLLGAQQIVGGTISKLGTTFTVSARLVDVETGKIIAVSDYDLNGALEDLLVYGMRRVALRLVGIKLAPLSVLDPKKAFYKSLLIPGQGQLYVDSSAPKRQLKSNLQLGGAIFCWLMNIGGSSIYKDEMANADYLFGIDPGGRDSTLYDESDAIDKNAYEWQEGANMSRSITRFFGGMAVVIHVSSALNARGMAKEHNLRRPGYSMHIEPSRAVPSIVFSYRF